jgi:hypothetical protein
MGCIDASFLLSLSVSYNLCSKLGTKHFFFVFCGDEIMAILVLHFHFLDFDCIF